MSTTIDALGLALDRQDFNYLLEDSDSQEVLAALEDKVRNGVEPEVIGRYIAKRIGDHRVGTIHRCIGAARYMRHLQTQQASA